MSTLQQPETSGIRNNYLYGSVGEFLKAKIVPGSMLSVLSAYFTIYAYDLLREPLNTIERLRFLFGEPRFLKALDPKKTDKKAFKIEDESLRLANRLEQWRVARECAGWLAARAEIRSIKRYH